MGNDENRNTGTGGPSTSVITKVLNHTHAAADVQQRCALQLLAHSLPNGIQQPARGFAGAVFHVVIQVGLGCACIKKAF